jgi:hypothetical protein
MSWSKQLLDTGFAPSETILHNLELLLYGKKKNGKEKKKKRGGKLHRLQMLRQAMAIS